MKKKSSHIKVLWLKNPEINKYKKIQFFPVVFEGVCNTWKHKYKIQDKKKVDFLNIVLESHNEVCFPF